MRHLPSSRQLHFDFRGLSPAFERIIGEDHLVFFHELPDQTLGFLFTCNNTWWSKHTMCTSLLLGIPVDGTCQVDRYDKIPTITPPPLHCFCAVLDDMSPPLFCLHPPPTHLTPTASQRLVSTILLVTTDDSIQNFSSPSIRRGRAGGITTVQLMLKIILCLRCMVVTCNVMHTIKWTFFSSTTQTDTKPTVQ